MTQLGSVLVILVPALYALAWADYALLFFRDHPLARRTASPLLLATLALHLLTLSLQAAALRRCPMGSFPEVLSILVICVAAVYLVLETRQGNRYTGVFVLGLLLPVTLISFTLPAPDGPVSKLLKSPLFGLHTTLALLGYAAFAVCAIYCVMYLLLHRTLKRQVFGLIFQRLPSLDGMAAMTVGAAVIGFASLTLTIAVGILWGARVAPSELMPAGGSFWSDPKILFTVVVWAVYGVAISARFLLRWPNRSVVLLFLAGFVMAVFAVIILNTWLHTFHRFTA